MSTGSVVSMPTPSEPVEITDRYDESYKLASQNIDFGNFVKAFGVLAGALTIIVTIAFARRSAEILFAGTFLGVVGGLALFCVGSILAAQGEALRATLDSAINTATLLGRTDRAKVAGLGRTA